MDLDTILFRGSGVALVTPFKNNEIDFEALDRLIDFHLKNNTDALIVCGTTGEPSTMSEKEKDSVIAYTAGRVKQKIPVIAGTGGNDTKKAIEAALRAKELGADAQLCVTPYYNKTTQHGLIAHYHAIAENTELPIFVYNVPARTGLNILPETLKEIATHKNIVAMKEASGDLFQSMEMMRLCGDSIKFYSGMDEIVYPLLALGFYGVISVSANILPRELHELGVSFQNKTYEKGLALQYKLNPLHKLLFCETNPVPVKAAMALMGLCDSEVRMPLVPILDTNKNKLAGELKALGLI